jgi:hypothetical protein
MYSVPYYPQFHITAVGLGTYYPCIQGHYGICLLEGGTRNVHGFFLTLPAGGKMIELCFKISVHCCNAQY